MFGASLLAIRDLASLGGVSWLQLYAAALLGWLNDEPAHWPPAFDAATRAAKVRVEVLLGSLASAAVGYAVLRSSSAHPLGRRRTQKNLDHGSVGAGELRGAAIGAPPRDGSP